MARLGGGTRADFLLPTNRLNGTQGRSTRHTFQRVGCLITRYLRWAGDAPTPSAISQAYRLAHRFHAAMLHGGRRRLLTKPLGRPANAEDVGKKNRCTNSYLSGFSSRPGAFREKLSFINVALLTSPQAIGERGFRPPLPRFAQKREFWCNGVHGDNGRLAAFQKICYDPVK